MAIIYGRYQSLMHGDELGRAIDGLGRMPEVQDHQLVGMDALLPGSELLHDLGARAAHDLGVPHIHDSAFCGRVVIAAKN
jgi:hypothetical protein